MAIKLKKWKWLWRGIKKAESRWTLPHFGNLFCYLLLFQLLTKSLMNLESSHVSLRDHSVCFNIENIFRLFGDCGANFVFLNQINKNSRWGGEDTSEGNNLVTTWPYQPGDSEGCLFIESDTWNGHECISLSKYMLRPSPFPHVPKVKKTLVLNVIYLKW